MHIAHFLDRKVDQLGFVVEDVYKTIEEYQQRFNIGNWKIYTYGPPLLKTMLYRGDHIQYKSKIALSYFGETRVEIIQHLEGKTIYTDFIEKHGYGLQHLGIYVQNIEASIIEAKQAGFSVIMEGGGGLDGDGYFAYLDTEEKLGITYELIQRPLRRHKPEQVYPFLNATR
jgi:hypothetical protein